MMAAFIVAIGGTVGQAAMLGLAATVSHTAVVWAVAMGGLYLGRNWTAESTEPYLQLVSGVVIVGVAAWMVWRTWRMQSGGEHGHTHGHDDHGHHQHSHSLDDSHAHSHSHDRGEEVGGHGTEERWVDFGHGAFRLELHEEGVPPRFRLAPEAGRSLGISAGEIEAEIERPDGRLQRVSFVQRDGYFESAESVDEPHEFFLRVRVLHHDQVHDFDYEFTEPGHRHAVEGLAALDLTSPGYSDPHELAHANDIRRRFANRKVTNGQILTFGLTGGLIPCPAAITVLLLCLQLKEIALGATLVVSFSVGLALTLVLSGVIAALSVRHASKRWSGFGEIARKAPYFSGGLILLVGLYVGYQGFTHLP